MKKFLVLLTGIVLLAGCGYHADIEQEVGVDSAINCTYRVETLLWVKGFLGTYVSIEKGFREYNVEVNMIEAVKEKQLQSLLPYEAALKGALERGDCLPFKTE